MQFFKLIKFFKCAKNLAPVEEKSQCSGVSQKYKSLKKQDSSTWENNF